MQTQRLTLRAVRDVLPRRRPGGSTAPQPIELMMRVREMERRLERRRARRATASAAPTVPPAGRRPSGPTPA